MQTQLEGFACPKKSNPHYTRIITPERVTSGRRRGSSLQLSAWVTQKRRSGAH